jgi:hypothetical protein
MPISIGNLESGRISSLISDARLCATRAAINKARTTVYCPPLSSTNRQVPPTSSVLQGKMDSCSQITSDRATVLATQSLRGVPESVRIKNLQQQTWDAYAPYNNPSRRFLEYQGPQIPTVCPTPDRNGNLPKPSNSCTSLALINAGRP